MTRGWFGRGKPWDTRYCDPRWPAVVVLGCPYVLHHRPCFCTCSCSFYTPAHSTDTHIHAREICKTPTFKLPKVSCRGKLEVINGTGSKAMHQTGLLFPFMPLFSTKAVLSTQQRKQISNHHPEGEKKHKQQPGEPYFYTGLTNIWLQSVLRSTGIPEMADNICTKCFITCFSIFSVCLMLINCCSQSRWML